VTAETGAAIITWDGRRGGLMTRFAVKDGQGVRELIREGTWPAFVAESERRRAALADAAAKVEVVFQDADEAEFVARATLGGAGVELRYEVFAEGAVFCEMRLAAPAEAGVRLGRVAMSFAVDVRDAGLRWGYVSREQRYLRDPTCIHVMPFWRTFLAANERVERRELLPMAWVDLGWGKTRLFSNHVEFLMEDWTALGEGPLENTRSTAGVEAGAWRLRWELCDEGGELAAGSVYRNTWAVLFGAARTEAGAEAEPARRNNLLGARVCHCSYPYARQLREWPWRSMPGTQSKHVPPRFFNGLPDPSRADEAARRGADTMIVHQFWMRNPGSNNEPVADYQPLDASWLKAFVGRCHELGMRVLLYMRGTEQHALYSGYFEEFLEKDRDGLYVDWSCPLASGWSKASGLHFSARNYFLFTRALRRRVGGRGLLLAHSSMHCLVALASFDACLSGEGAAQRDSLLDSAEGCASYGFLAGCGGHLISGNPYDRPHFASPRAAAYAAALGMANHTPLGPDTRYDAATAFVQPLWRMLASLGGRVTRLHSPAVGTAAAEATAQGVWPLVYEAGPGRALLLVSNLGPATDVEVTVDLEKLGGVGVAPLDVAAAREAKAAGGRVALKGLREYGVCGFEVKGRV